MGTSVTARRLVRFVNITPAPLPGRPTLGDHSIIVVEEYPSVRGACTNPYSLTLVNLIGPIGEQIADILIGGQTRTPSTNDTHTHPEEPAHHIVGAGHLHFSRVLSNCH
jgi:hypothetical protein